MEKRNVMQLNARRNVLLICVLFSTPMLWPFVVVADERAEALVGINAKCSPTLNIKTLFEDIRSQEINADDSVGLKAYTIRENI